MLNWNLTFTERIPMYRSTFLNLPLGPVKRIRVRKMRSGTTEEKKSFSSYFQLSVIRNSWIIQGPWQDRKFIDFTYIWLILLKKNIKTKIYRIKRETWYHIFHLYTDTLIKREERNLWRDTRNFLWKRATQWGGKSFLIILRHSISTT